MAIKAVVFDIGGVLEVIDDSTSPGPWCERHNVSKERLDAAFVFPLDPAIGEMSQEEVLAHLQRELDLTDEQVAELDADQWRWYIGTLDRALYDWFAGLRDRGLRAGILSNSWPAAREHEACWGFEKLVDVLVYSHEVALKKPDPQVYHLTADRLGVAPDEIAFLDDWLPAVDAALAAGWHAVHHVETPASIAALEELIAE